MYIFRAESPAHNSPGQRRLRRRPGVRDKNIKPPCKGKALWYSVLRSFPAVQLRNPGIFSPLATNPDISYRFYRCRAIRNLAALRLFGRLDILSNMSALPARRAPCSYARLRALNTKRYEISGLTTRHCRREAASSKKIY